MTNVVNTINGTSSFGTSPSLSLGFTMTSGNTAVLMIECGQVPTLTGSFASATLEATSTGQSGTPIYVYTLKNVGAYTTLAASLGSSTSFTATVIELQGSWDYDSFIRATVTAGTSVTASVSATAAGQVIIGHNDASNARTSVTPTSGFTLVSNPWYYSVYMDSTSGSGSVSCGLTWTGSVNSAMVAVLYKPTLSGITGDLAATESGADTFVAAGNIAVNGIRLTLRDTDTGALAASLTGMIVSIRENSDDEATIAKSASETTDGSGVLEFASTAIGDVGDYVYVTVEKSDHSIVAAYRVQVIDLNA